MWLRQGLCCECEAVAYLRRDVGPTTLQRAPSWRAYVAGGRRGVAPAVAEVLWVRVCGDLEAAAWPTAISAGGEPDGVRELLETTDGPVTAPPICPACRAGASARSA